MSQPQALGLIFPVSYGIQIDLCAVNRQQDGRTITGSLCDHNCTSEFGGYDCPAAFTRNKGFKANFAPKDSIVNWVLTGREGLRLATESFLEHNFSGYCAEFRVPPDVREALHQNMAQGLCEVNLFGGDPEMHPQVMDIIARLKNEGFRVNLTTTGRKFLTSESFVKRFAQNPAHLLALSADDFDPERLEELFSMSLSGLKAAWKKIDPRRGQEQKFFEAVYAARLAKEEGWPCTILFNMVLHKGNLPYVRQMMQAITRHLPNALVNPYPAQDSFDHGPGNLFDSGSVLQFASLAEWLIQETVNGNPNLTKRLQYWLVMKAVLENCTTEYPNAVSQLVSGHHIWQCYQRAGAGMYLQIGKGNNGLINIGPAATEPGGFPGCYWNSSTVTGGMQIASAEQVSSHVLRGMQEHAKASTGACPGCSMPRLWFNMVSTELGLNPGLVATYLRLRHYHVGF